jgi:Zn-dependent M16 (insulinase) family peptidase
MCGEITPLAEYKEMRKKANKKNKKLLRKRNKELKQSVIKKFQNTNEAMASTQSTEPMM